MTKNAWQNLAVCALLAATAWLVVARNLPGDESNQLLNVSYDPTRELYRDLNEQFIDKYKQQTGAKLTIKQSHGGSSAQARAAIEGLAADVVTLATYGDVDALRKRGLIADGWPKRLPHNSVPYYSTIVFVVRKGNPRGIKDWPDLIKDDITIISPNPKTSGNGKLSFLAAWGSTLRKGGDEAAARAFVTRVYEHIPVLDTGARGATTRFAGEKIGDVHLTWENEALREVEDSRGDLQVVYPPSSIQAEPCVAWVDSNVRPRGREAEAKAYLQFLFTEPAQETIARHGYRPVDAGTLKKHAGRLPPIELFPVTLIAKDWDEIQQKFFADNGIFDAIYRPKMR